MARLEEREREIATLEAVSAEAVETANAGAAINDPLRTTTDAPATGSAATEAQRRLCERPTGMLRLARDFTREAGSRSMSTSRVRTLTRLMCTEAVPCDQAFERVLDRDYEANRDAVQQACRF